MAKQLTVFSRVVVLLLGASFVLALLVSSLSASRSSHLPLDAIKWGAISLSGWRDHSENRTSCYLIDRASSDFDVVPMPSDKRWGQLSVSPWCDAEGSVEGVCQSFMLPDVGAEHSFWGLARLRLPEGELIDELKLDLFPTGRACWVPALPGRILFAAGDGQLYRHDFPGWSSKVGAALDDATVVSNESTLCRVIWKSSPPLEGSVFITDPFWPTHPRLRHLVFATLIPQSREEIREVTEATELLWFIMSDDGAVIEASGLLDLPKNKPSGDRSTRKRFPNVELGQDGTIRLVYLWRVQGDLRDRLEVVAIEIDPATGHPRVPACSVSRTLDEDCAPVSPLFSADGMSVYMVSRNSGRIVKRQIP